jgi:uncharacterized protein YkwD
LSQTKGEPQTVRPSAAAGAEFSRPPRAFRYAGRVLLALLVLLADALPAQARLEASVLDGIAGSCPGRKVAIDPDLTRACRAFAAAVHAGRAPITGPAASFFASLESYEPAPVAGIATVSPSSRADRAAGELYPKTCRFDRIGVAAAELKEGGAVVCALTAVHGTTLSRIPGRVEAGQIVDVEGTLAAGLENPRLYVTRPSGDVEEIGLAAAGAAFSARVPLRGRGEHSIEVLADGPGGPEVAAIRRVFAGLAPASKPPPEARGGEGLAGVEEAIARLRSSHGLPGLERDPELDAAAEAHSREMARLRTFAHVLPTDGSPGDRLRARGYAYRSIGENIGLSSDVATAHEAIAGSPAHLANLLDPRHRRLGLGAASGLTADGNEGVYLTEIFAVPAISAADPVAEIVRLIAAERKRRGLPPLRRDPALDGVAVQEVRRTAASDQMKLDQALAGRALSQVPRLSGAVAELYVGNGPDAVGSSRNVAERKWTRLGVGAQYGTSSQYGPGRLWVLLLYGR